jgi:serine protease AprX
LSRITALFAALLVVTSAALSDAVAASNETAPTEASVLIHAAPDRWRAALDTARAFGLHTGTTYPMIDVFVAGGSQRALAQLANDESIAYVEANSPIDYFTDTSHDATRGNEVLSGAIRWRGRKIDGRGVGVAIVDSGIDGTHPDLAGRLGGNVMIVCTRPGFLIGTVTECGGPKQAVPLDDTDSAALSGHGTHVAGIVAGTGAASDGTFHGAAPGATLYGVGIGTVLLVENALDGLRWVLDNHDRVEPAIRVGDRGE